MKINEILTERINAAELHRIVYKAVNDSLTSATMYMIFPESVFGDFINLLKDKLTFEIKKIISDESASNINFIGIVNGDKSHIASYTEENVINIELSIGKKLRVACYTDISSLFFYPAEKRKKEALLLIKQASFINLISVLVHEILHIIQQCKISVGKNFKDFSTTIDNNANKNKKISNIQSRSVVRQSNSHPLKPAELDAIAKEIVSKIISYSPNILSEPNGKEILLKDIIKVSRISRPEIKYMSTSTDPHIRRKFKKIISRIYQDVVDFLKEQHNESN